MSYHFHGRDVSKAVKVLAIAEVYMHGDTAEKLAEKLSHLVGREVTKSTLLGFYHRHKPLVAKYPLKGHLVPKRPLPDRCSHDKKSGSVARTGKDDDKLIDIRRRNERLPSETASLVSGLEDDDSLRVPLMQLIARQCRWPTHFDKERGQLCCGHKKDPNHGSYCLKHKKRAVGG